MVDTMHAVVCHGPRGLPARGGPRADVRGRVRRLVRVEAVGICASGSSSATRGASEVLG